VCSSDLDESSMEGVRIVLEIKRDSDPSVVLNNLYKRTPLQTSFAGNLMAVVGAGRLPEQLTLRSALLAFLDFRIECIERRSRGRLTKTQARLHVVDGLLVAQQDMDGVVATIRAADDTAGARAALMSKFGLSQEQSDAILQLQLRRLTALERASLVEEAETLQARRADLQGLLAERSKVLALIGEELAELKSKFDTPRRSQLGSADDADVEDIDLTANEQCIIIRSLKGYVKRMPLAEFEAQNRGTRGKAGANMRDGDAIVQMEQCTTHDTMLCLSDAGVAYALPAYKVPESSRTSRGVLVHQLLPITNQEAIATMLPVRSYSPERYLLLLTRDGWIKKTPLAAFERITARGLIAVSLSENDALVRASLCEASDDVLMCSTLGLAMRFQASATDDH
jgi:DNA gyrase subunit A